MTAELTSIIIPVRNQWTYTRQCLAAIRRFTPTPHEVIVIDNRSTDDTVWALGKQPGIRRIRNEVNRGFAAAVNQGLKAARGTVTVLLNNDTLVSHRWLSQLLTVLKAHPRNGMVGPVSNRVIPEQKVAVSLTTPQEVHRYCARHNRSDPRQWRQADRLSGFCLMFPTRLIQEVGDWDERFGVGTFEDDDYSWRVKRAGYRLIVAGDTYVHHYGSRSFRKRSYREFRKILEQNRRYFEQKHQKNPDRC
ncbi:glycosyltransferase family 2 protein [Desmospora profundinema]|uniref:GT2 family glycosyltransferase n=1 Tax=Desmospora profundinema TaxID=1571184 RepID=A0ABU1IJG5_9BACL|nr:glycosyltransferase family 2 protein [Desmospora profundinema]MDR6224304.1 GT2 family glycosyltransferase [Desmospora profundinema]